MKQLFALPFYSIFITFCSITYTYAKEDTLSTDLSSSVVDSILYTDDQQEIYLDSLPDDLLPSDTLVKKEIPYARAWTIDPRFGRMTPTAFDTLDLNFQNRQLVEYKDVAVNYLGTIGAPAESKIYFNRDESHPFIFLQPYSLYLKRPDRFRFMNTKRPFSMLTYNRDLNKREGEEYFDALFSVNVNKKLAFGFEYDLVYGRGYYSAQSTSHSQFALFGNYLGERYQAHAYLGTRAFKNYENGGITDDRYITDPQAMSGGKREFEPRNIPVYMNDATSRLFGRIAYYTHHYDLGFYRETADTTSGDFVPVTSFIHTLQYEDFSKRYKSNTIPENYYEQTYFNTEYTADHTQYRSIKNTLAISLLEGFNKYSKFGLLAFIEHDFRRYKLDDWEGLYRGKNKFATTVGGELSKQQGQLLTFSFRGELGIAGEEMGQFKLNGTLGTQFRIRKDTIRLQAIGSFKNLTPKYYFEHYASNHFKWDNSFKDEQQVSIGGLFSLPKRGTKLKVDVANLTRSIYFNGQALPTQAKGNVQVVSVQLYQDFKVGILHLDNAVVYQKSSDQSVLPLPEVSLYHNLYLMGRLFKKELFYQVGADVRFHTRYYVPSYMPATGQFYNQDQIKNGAYPLVNVYLNFHLKNMRFYAMAYHVNSSMGSPRYFIQPHYPMNPFHLKFGLAWNFHN